MPEVESGREVDEDEDLTRLVTEPREAALDRVGRPRPMTLVDLGERRLVAFVETTEQPQLVVPPPFLLHVDTPKSV